MRFWRSPSWKELLAGSSVEGLFGVRVPGVLQLVGTNSAVCQPLKCSVS